MARKLVLVVLVGLVAGGCAYMRMQKPPSTEIVRCGTVQTPFWYWQEAAQREVYVEYDCIEKHLADGYAETLPEPYFFIISSGSLYTGSPTYTKMP